MQDRAGFSRKELKHASVQKWVFGALLGAILAGTILLLGTSSIGGAKPGRPEGRDHWQHHDGRWSFWHAADQRWYYTDGIHWFFRDGNAWRLYRFDRKFGHDCFERGEYKVPAEHERIVVPRHDVFRH